MITLIFQEIFHKSNDYSNVIITGIFTLLAVIITLGFNWLINYRSYKNEYYKKIIDKRIKSYESLEELLNHMSISIKKGNSFIFEFCTNHQNILNVFNKLLELEKDLYLSAEMLDKLGNLDNYLHEKFFYPITNKNDFSEEQLISLGIKYYLELRGYVFEIYMIIYNDLQILFRVKKFIKSKYVRSEHEKNMVLKVLDKKTK